MTIGATKNRAIRQLDHRSNLSQVIQGSASYQTGDEAETREPLFQ